MCLEFVVIRRYLVVTVSQRVPVLFLVAVIVQPVPRLGVRRTYSNMFTPVVGVDYVTPVTARPFHRERNTPKCTAFHVVLFIGYSARAPFRPAYIGKLHGLTFSI